MPDGMARPARQRLGRALVVGLAFMVPIEAQAFPVDLDTPQESSFAARFGDLAPDTPPQAEGTALARGESDRRPSPADAQGALPGLPDGFVAEPLEARVASTSPAPRPAASLPQQVTTAAPHAPLRTPPEMASRGPLASATQQFGENDSNGQILFPLSGDVGVAAFQRRDRLFVFFGTTTDIALPATTGMFTGASVKSRPTMELVSLTVPSGRSVRLCRVKAGWLLADAASAPCREAPSIAPMARAGGLFLAAGSPAQVLRTLDPESEAPLLVGMVHDELSGRVATPVVTSAGSVMPSVVGVVVSAQTDGLELQRLADGFALAPWSDVQTATERSLASHFTRTLNLPGATAEAARLRLEAARRLLGTNETTASAAVLTEAAEAAIGAGDGGLALHYAALAQSQGQGDARVHPELMLVGAIAHALNHDTASANDPIVSHSDEDEAWRAALSSADDAQHVAPCNALASALNVFSSYPDPLRAQVLPEVAERAASCGNAHEIDAVERLGDDPALRYAKAFAELRREGSKAALGRMDALTHDRDPVTAYKAEMADVGERVHRGLMTPKQAAERLDDLLFAARMAGDTQKWRVTLADDLAAAGDRARALSVLKDAQPLTPALRKRARELLGMVADARPTSPQDRLQNAATLLKNVDLSGAPAGSPDDLRIAVGEALLADGFPAKVLEILPQTATGAGVSEGLRIASARANAALALGDSTTALAALGVVAQSADATPQQVRSLTLLRARADEAANDCAGALQVLSESTHDAQNTTGFQSESDMIAARCMARLGRWVDAEQPLARLAAQIPAGRDALDDADQDTVMRYATAASNAGDEGLVTRLVATFGSRVEPGLQSALRALSGDTNGTLVGATRIAQLPEP